MIKVECTWGDGPDVVVTLEQHRFLLLEEPKDSHQFIHGVVQAGQIDLTAGDAELLAIQLQAAARKARELQAMIKEHDSTPA